MIRHDAKCLHNKGLFFSIFLFSFYLTGFVSAQDHPSSVSINAEKLLKDALLFSVDVDVTAPGSNVQLWNTRVEKITIPGRAVEVILEGVDSKLKVIFTLYPAEDGDFLLVARSEIRVEGEYSSTHTSLPIGYHDKVYYYPLGRAVEGENEDNPVEVRMAINVVLYLETLDEEARSSLEAAFNASAQFNLSWEEP